MIGNEIISYVLGGRGDGILDYHEKQDRLAIRNIEEELSKYKGCGTEIIRWHLGMLRLDHKLQYTPIEYMEKDENCALRIPEEVGIGNQHQTAMFARHRPFYLQYLADKTREFGLTEHYEAIISRARSSPIPDWITRRVAEVANRPLHLRV